VKCWLGRKLLVTEGTHQRIIDTQRRGVSGLGLSRSSEGNGKEEGNPNIGGGTGRLALKKISHLSRACRSLKEEHQEIVNCWTGEKLKDMVNRLVHPDHSGMKTPEGGEQGKHLRKEVFR